MLHQSFKLLNKEGVTIKYLCRRLNIGKKQPLRAKKYMPTNLHPIIRENISDPNVENILQIVADELNIKLGNNTLQNA